MAFESKVNFFEFFGRCVMFSFGAHGWCYRWCLILNFRVATLFTSRSLRSCGEPFCSRWAGKPVSSTSADYASRSAWISPSLSRCLRSWLVYCFALSGVEWLPQWLWFCLILSLGSHIEKGLPDGVTLFTWLAPSRFPSSSRLFLLAWSTAS